MAKDLYPGGIEVAEGIYKYDEALKATTAVLSLTSEVSADRFFLREHGKGHDECQSISAVCSGMDQNDWKNVTFLRLPRVNVQLLTSYVSWGLSDVN